MLAWGSAGGSSVSEFVGARRPVGAIAQQRLVRMLALGACVADVVLAVDHLAALRIGHDVVRGMVVAPLALLGVAAVAGRGDGLGGVELGFDRARGRADRAT